MLRKKEKVNFYTLLIQQAQCTVDGVKLLCAYCANPDEACGDQIKELEMLGDRKRSHLIAEINNSFITPIDREDLFRLSGTIDDVLDYAWYTVKELRIYHIDPDRAIGDMAPLLLEMAESLRDCMRMLEHNTAQCNFHAVQDKKLENRLNARFHQAMNDLFEQEDLRAILKYREVYAHFNHASDKGDHAADILLDILVKS